MKPALRTIKSFVRDTVGETLRVSGLSSPALWANDRLTIVTFHRVLPPALLSGYPLPAIAVTPDELDEAWAADGRLQPDAGLAAAVALPRAAPPAPCRLRLVPGVANSETNLLLATPRSTRARI